MVVSETRIVALTQDAKIADYFKGNSHRLAAYRLVLDLLDIELPDWAERRPSGRQAHSADLVSAALT